jgi:hypothetical protein
MHTFTIKKIEVVNASIVDIVRATIFLLFLIISISSKGQNRESDIKGLWFVKDFNNAQVEIKADNKGIWFGKIIASDDKKEIGKIILSDCIFDHSKGEYKGMISDGPIDVNLIISFININKLKVVGKVLFIKKTYYWIRIKQ